jgi:hypothetical protein
VGGLLVLEKLYLKANSIGAAGACALADALCASGAPALEMLDSTCNSTGARAGKRSADERCTSIQKAIPARQLHRPRGRVLADVMRAGGAPMLEMLGMEYNNVGDEGVLALADTLWAGAALALKKLGLSYKSMGTEGVRALADAFVAGFVLTLAVLYLRNNSFGVEGWHVTKGHSGAARGGTQDVVPHLRIRSPPMCR